MSFLLLFSLNSRENRDGKCWSGKGGMEKRKNFVIKYIENFIFRKEWAPKKIMTEALKKVTNMYFDCRLYTEVIPKCLSDRHKLRIRTGKMRFLKKCVNWEIRHSVWHRYNRRIIELAWKRVSDKLEQDQ